jgi:putative transposase
MYPAAARAAEPGLGLRLRRGPTRDTRKFRMLCVGDEFTREALAIKVARRLDSNHVIEVLADLCLGRGVPEHIRSDQRPEFIATTVKDWIAAVGAKTAYIEKSSPPSGPPPWP